MRGVEQEVGWTGLVARLVRRSLAAGTLAVLVACGGGGEDGGSAAPASGPPPPPTPELALVVGEYASANDTVSILEEGQALYFLPWGGEAEAMEPTSEGAFSLVGRGTTLTLLAGGATGAGNPVGFSLAGTEYDRLALGGEEGETFQITPLRSPEELEIEALAAGPLQEEGDFLPSDLVELTALDPTILLDVRYASTNNFMGAVFYSSPRAFLQRPAAEAVARAHQWLKDRGYGLLIHDGYRPWYVTKMFWDATPEELRNFVADPANGSRHNRGCAVDLTLYDLATGEPVTMPSGFDEFSPRSFSEYPGGTSRQRWWRALLREAMEGQGFTVYPDEWWHFDYQDWRRYTIENQVFEEIEG